MDDRALFEETRTAMNMIGMTASDQSEVFRTVAAILHIGNIQLAGDAKASVSNKDVLKIAAKLLRVPEADLETVRRPFVGVGEVGWEGAEKHTGVCVHADLKPKRSGPFAARQALTTKTIDVNNDNVVTPLDKQAAAHSRDSLAKSMCVMLCAPSGATPDAF